MITEDLTRARFPDMVENLTVTECIVEDCLSSIETYSLTNPPTYRDVVSMLGNILVEDIRDNEARYLLQNGDKFGPLQFGMPSDVVNCKRISEVVALANSLNSSIVWHSAADLLNFINFVNWEQSEVTMNFISNVKSILASQA